MDTSLEMQHTARVSRMWSQACVLYPRRGWHPALWHIMERARLLRVLDLCIHKPSGLGPLARLFGAVSLSITYIQVAMWSWWSMSLVQAPMGTIEHGTRLVILSLSRFSLLEAHSFPTPSPNGAPAQSHSHFSSPPPPTPITTPTPSTMEHQVKTASWHQKEVLM